MKVTIDISGGPDITNRRAPTKQDIKKNIDALEWAIDIGCPACHLAPLVDTRGILEEIQHKLPGEDP